MKSNQSEMAQKFAETYLAEARDLLEQVQEVVLQIETRPDDTESINQLFRAFHTIKGSGAAFGFDEVARFTHHVETYLDQVRNGSIQITRETIDLVLAASDTISDLLVGKADQRKADSLAMKFEKLAITKIVNEGPDSRIQDSITRQTKHYQIRFRPAADLFTSGMNPVCLLNELRDLGQCTVRCLNDSVPVLSELDPESCHLAWEIDLQTDRGDNAIRDVFMFVEDGAELSIKELDENAFTLLEPKRNPISAKAQNATMEHKSANVSQGSSATEDTIVRVSSGRLDRLVGLVGELVINQARLSQVSARIISAELDNVAKSMEHLVSELRDSVLGIRMTPIGSTFTRFQRLIRDLSKDLGKEVDFITEGGATELDKTVLDRLSDPLLHLIRNSMDHGIEFPSARVAVGKPALGTIRLTASHEGGAVAITLKDDGHGLDRSAILAKAMERGLVSAEANLSEQEIFGLIFLPGFSTAREVSSVSGRGVGMDVVRRTIDGLRGSVYVESQPGAGTTFHLKLPLTLAIIEGLLVEVDHDPYIIPMAAVRENVELYSADRKASRSRKTVTVRGDLIPFIRLRDLFEARGTEPEYETVVITLIDGERVGLVVDRVIGTHQTVIQPLGGLCRNLKIASGTTILGDGRVALILNPPGIIRTGSAQIESAPLSHSN